MFSLKNALKKSATPTASPKTAPKTALSKNSLFGFQRFKRDTSGVTALEFAMVATPFFAFMFAIMEIAFWFLGVQVLENAVDLAGRKVRTGEVASMTEAEFKTEICNNITVLLNCDDVIINVGPFSDFGSVSTTDHTDADGNLDAGATGSFTACPPNSVCMVQATVEWDLLLNIPSKFGGIMGIDQGVEINSGGTNNKTILTATMVFRAEPYL